MYGSCGCEPREWSKAERIALIEHKEKMMQERLNYLRQLKASIQQEADASDQPRKTK